ncbi:neutral sphingomyelinase isoform X2 [Tachypleus tridentatus]|uniref:neutral sphingomyelinase isoform X2 n=1 Tax=Tachypleus tridentatus TaxID=6853 RepID=UPI003FD1D633
MKMETELKVLTLNCWGIVGFSRDRTKRMAAIASHLAISDYDFVFLQEVWSQDDYQMISKKVSEVLPYSFYFHSGVVGSGVCILSRSRIIDTGSHAFSLNGYAHKIQHGDWFGGKVVGLCKVLHRGIRINLYVTHFHAEYNKLHDQYLAHRIAQAFEFSQFVQLTSETADLTIMAGDFNTEPEDLPYRIILNNTDSQDTFLMQPTISDSKVCIATCGHPRNTYTSKQELSDAPQGIRIDYVFLKHGKVEEPEVNNAARITVLEEAGYLLNASLVCLRKNCIFYFMLSCFLLCLLLLSTPFNLPYGLNAVMIFSRIVLSIGLGFCLWMCSVMNNMEQKALLGACNSIQVLLASLKEDRGIEFDTMDLKNPTKYQTESS